MNIVNLYPQIGSLVWSQHTAQIEWQYTEDILNQHEFNCLFLLHSPALHLCLSSLLQRINRARLAIYDFVCYNRVADRKLPENHESQLIKSTVFGESIVHIANLSILTYVYACTGVLFRNHMCHNIFPCRILWLNCHPTGKLQNKCSVISQRIMTNLLSVSNWGAGWLSKRNAHNNTWGIINSARDPTDWHWDGRWETPATAFAFKCGLPAAPTTTTRKFVAKMLAMVYLWTSQKQQKQHEIIHLNKLPVVIHGHYQVGGQLLDGGGAAALLCL